MAQLSGSNCRHVRRGIVTNQPDGYDSNRPHCSIAVCDRPECIRKAAGEVASFTFETPYWRSDATRVAEAVSA